MNRESFRVFDRIRAGDALKEKTAGYLRERIRENSNRSRGGRAGVRAFAAAFSCLAVLLVCGVVSWRLYFSPVAYIDIEINPSIELTVNQLGQVIHAGARNEDGEDILSGTKLSGAGYSEAVGLLLDALAASGYFTKDSLLCITVQADERGREESILSGLQEAVESAERRCRHRIEADVYAVTDEIKHCADENQISPAKYLAIQELLQVEPDADFEECKGHSVHELRQRTRECRRGQEEQEKTESPEESGEREAPGLCEGEEEHGGYHHGHGHSR